MFTRWRLPPESVAHLVVGAVAQAGQVEHPVHRRLDVGAPLQPREQAQVLGHGELAVERRLLRAPSRSRSGARLTLPLVGRWMPARIDSSVVLPAPFGPITATSSPAAGRERHAAQRLARRRSA